MSNGVFGYNVALWILSGIAIKVFVLSPAFLIVTILLTSIPKYRVEEESEE
jgi:hypothetical protein